MMPDILTVVINDEAVLEYDRDKPLPTQQEAFLEKMDTEMGEGIVVDGVSLEKPELSERSRFVALNLISALDEGNDPKAAAMCAWLATRLPDLQQVVASLVDGRLGVDLVFDRPYVKEVKVGVDQLTRQLKDRQ